MGFAIWSIVALLMIVMGVLTLFSKKAVGFWANAEMFEVTDVKGYNRAVGIMWIVFGVIFELTGIPILNPDNALQIVFMSVGSMIEAIILMLFYTFVIERKYKKR